MRLMMLMKINVYTLVFKVFLVMKMKPRDDQLLLLLTRGEERSRTMRFNVHHFQLRGILNENNNQCMKTKKASCCHKIIQFSSPGQIEMFRKDQQHIFPATFTSAI